MKKKNKKKKKKKKKRGFTKLATSKTNVEVASLVKTNNKIIVHKVRVYM
jgi:hypothetical protein